MNDEQHVVVAGVSPGERREPMVRWAATEAVSRGARLRLVAAVPPHTVPDTYVRSGVADLPATAHRVLDRARRYAVSACPGVTVSTEVLDGPPADVLRETAAGADLLVVGADDQGALAEAVSGSVPGDLVATAPCPLAVVPATGPTIDVAAPITLALDPGGSSQAALAYAFSAARRSGRRLDVVRCAAGGTPAEEPAALDGFRRLYPDVEVTCRVETGDPGETLARLSYESALLVLGSRGRRRLAATLFGSVGRTLIHHSACPVVVARSRRS